MTFADTVRDLVDTVFNPLVGLLIAVALAVFFWGLVKYLGSAGEEDNREKAKALMVWGVIGLFVMLAVWGLVTILINTFFPGGTHLGPPPLPRYP